MIGYHALREPLIMKEVLTKKFWLDAKKIFDEARREDPAPPASPKPILENVAESPEQSPGQHDGDGQSQDPGHQHVPDRDPLQP